LMIALERDGVPVLGSINFPIQDQLLIGSAETGTFLNGKPCSVSKTTKLSEATMILTNPRELYSETHGEKLQRLAKSVRLVRGFGDCYGYYLVATGLADLMVEPGQLKYYDVAPMPPILAGSGGVFTDLGGKIDLLNGQGLATNKHLHEQILQVLNTV
ncbi:MAG: inositol monophosphatase family protein, partial [Acidobacteriota bacterium]